MEHRPRQPTTPKPLAPAAAPARSHSPNLEPPHFLKLEPLTVPKDENRPTKVSPMAKPASPTPSSDTPLASEAGAEESPKPSEEEEREQEEREAEERAQREEAERAQREREWRKRAVLTIHINHHLAPFKVKLSITDDGISVNFLLANTVQDSVTPSYGDITRLCKQLASESDDFTGRDVIEFVGVRRYGIVTYILGKRRTFEDDRFDQLQL